jgi:hypothetical protein
VVTKKKKSTRARLAAKKKNGVPGQGLPTESPGGHKQKKSTWARLAAKKKKLSTWARLATEIPGGHQHTYAVPPTLFPPLLLSFLSSARRGLVKHFSMCLYRSQIRHA